MQIRPLRPTDQDALAAISARVGPSSGHGTPVTVTPRDADSTVVADLDGHPVGWATVGSTPDPGTGAVDALVVDPDHRGVGIGRRLLVAAGRLLAAAGHRRAELRVPVDEAGNPPAMPLELGWRPESPVRPPTTPEPGVDGVDMVRLELDLGVEDHVRANRRCWNDLAERFAGPGRRAYEPEHRRAPTWGIFGVPEAGVGFLDEVAGADVVELGCGTGYGSAWALEAGARSVVGLDNSPAQLATAAGLQREFGIRFPLVLADAEHAPLAGASFDVAISEYGAALWCDPLAWIPEAARLLRPGGRLVFLTNSILNVLTGNDYEADGTDRGQLRRPQAGLHRVAFPDTEGVEFHLPHGEMIRLLRRHGFTVEDLVELYAPAGAETAQFGVEPEWARSWPVEEVWIARLAG